MSKCIIGNNSQQGILRTITHNQYVKLYYQGQFTRLDGKQPIKKNHRRDKC
jgi:hypothetical protein